MSRTHFVVGTRGSALARWQTDHVTAALAHARATRELTPVEVEVRVITTQGDTSLAERLVGQIEKGFFTAELEAALRDGGIDWAVHSLKDLPTRIPAGLELAAVLERANPADWLVMHERAFVERGPDRLPLVEGARVGTSSLRRDAMLRTLASGCASLPLRGNVPTRVEKLRSGHYEAIVLAAAGVSRLDLPLDGLVVAELNPRRWQPAPGQGAVAVESRAGDADIQSLFAAVDHAPTRSATGQERAFLRVLEGGCSTPFGCYVDDGRAWLGRESGGKWVSATATLPADPAALDEAFIHAALGRLAEDNVVAQETAHDRPLWHRIR